MSCFSSLSQALNCISLLHILSNLNPNEYTMFLVMCIGWHDEGKSAVGFAVDFRNTLSEIFFRLTKEDDMAVPIIVESAARAFGNFFCTCNSLGIEVHSFLSDSLEIVSEWCKTNIQKNTVNSSSCCHRG